MGQGCTRPLYARRGRKAGHQYATPGEPELLGTFPPREPVTEATARALRAVEASRPSRRKRRAGEENEDPNPNRPLAAKSKPAAVKPKPTAAKSKAPSPQVEELCLQLQELLPGVSQARAAAALEAAENDVERAAGLLMDSPRTPGTPPPEVFRLDQLPELLAGSRAFAAGGRKRGPPAVWFERLDAAVRAAGSLDPGCLHTLAATCANAALHPAGRAALVAADVATNLWAVGVGSSRAATVGECLRGLGNLLAGPEAAAYADGLGASGLLAALAAVPVPECVEVERLACLANLALVRPGAVPRPPPLPAATDLVHAAGAERAWQQLRLAANLAEARAWPAEGSPAAACARLGAALALAPDPHRVLALRALAALARAPPSAEWAGALGAEHLRALVAPLAARAPSEVQAAAQRALAALPGSRRALTPEPRCG